MKASRPSLFESLLNKERVSKQKKEKSITRNREKEGNILKIYWLHSCLIALHLYSKKKVIIQSFYSLFNFHLDVPASCTSYISVLFKAFFFSIG
jgi:hypothetical protein